MAKTGEYYLVQIVIQHPDRPQKRLYTILDTEWPSYAVTNRAKETILLNRLQSKLPPIRNGETLFYEFFELHLDETYEDTMGLVDNDWLIFKQRTF